MPVENLVTLFSPELIRHVASFMHPNYVATAFKLSCKDVAQAVREQFTTIQLRGEPRALQSFRFGSIIIALAEQPWPGAAFVAHWGRPEPWRPLNRRERHRLLCLAASSHHEPSLDAALAHCGTVIQADALASAIAAGDLAACRRLHESEGYDMEPELAAAAAGVAGSLPVCKWLVETVTSAIFTILPELCYARHSDAVELALRQADVSQRPGCKRRLLGAAAAAGRVELLRQLATRFPLSLKDEDGRPTVLSHVASGCPLEVLQQYYERWGSRLLWTAGQRRQLLMAAAASPTPDWAAKCEWLWAQWGGAAAGLGAGLGHVEGIDERVSNIMRRPDFPQRLQLLASYRLRDMIDRYAPEAAGTIGSTAAVEFCLDQLPALLRQQAVPAAGGGPAAAAGGPVPVAEQQQVAEDAAAQQQHVASLMLIAEAAAKHGRVPVLRLLRERGYIFPPDSLECVLTSLDMSFDGLTSLRYLLLEEPGAVEQGGADEDWSSLFRNAARSVADLPLLQHLHQRYASDCETATDLAVVAQGCSVEALEWVLATEAAAGRAPEPLSCVEFLEVLYSGNWAAADWLVRHGLVAASKQEVFEQLILECCDSNLIPELRWVMRSMGGGQEVHAQDHHQMPPVEWTPDLLAALHQVSNQYRLGVWHDTPARTEWLLALVATAEEALGGVTESG